MTDIKLLPLPVGYSADEWGGRDTGPCLYLDEQMQHYARANVRHHAAAQAAEIEALRADVADYMSIANAEANRAERLAEALQLIESAKGRGFGIDYARGLAQSALRDREEGK